MGKCWQRSTSLAVGGGAFQGLAKGTDVFGRDVVLAYFSASHVHPEAAIVALDHRSAGKRSAAEASYGIPRLIRLSDEIVLPCRRVFIDDCLVRRNPVVLVIN